MKEDSKYNTLQFFVTDNIGHLVLNKPPANRMNHLFFNELKNIVNLEIPAVDIKALIVSANGRHFSSGADLNEMMLNIADDKSFSKENKYPAFLEENNKTFLALSRLKIPVVAALKGICIGSAFELALFCHIRICAENTYMGLPESGFNLMPGCGGIYKLAEITGKAKAIELILTGKNISATEAKDLNIIHKIVSRNELLFEAGMIALRLAERNEFMDILQ